MLLNTFLIDNDGGFISPTTQLELRPNNQNNALLNIQLEFYDDIDTNSDGSITPKTPKMSGLAGSISFKARASSNAPYSDIVDVLDLSKNESLLQVQGVVETLQVNCTGVSGCNYIQVIIYEVGM